MGREDRPSTQRTNGSYRTSESGRGTRSPGATGQVRKELPTMMNHYEQKADLISRKYAEFMPDFEKQSDDRRIAFNCYQQLIGACEAMRDNGMENSFVCCAVNDSIRQQEAEIDEIITRFTGKVYKGVRWIDIREEMKGEKFTYGYVDCVIGMMTSKEAARKLLREQLYDLRNELTREHYFDMFEYINAATAGGGEIG